MLRRSALMLCLPALSPARAQTGATQTEWLAGDLPPFAWQSPTGPQGFGHELVVAMAERLGRPPTVTYLPWARAVKQAEEGDQFGVLPLARTPERELKFRWLAPLATVRYVFVGHAKERTLNLAELRARPVGALRGSPLVKTLQAEGFAQVREGKDYRELLRMLSLGSIHAIYAGAPMLYAAIDEYGHDRERFKSHLFLGEGTLYLAASIRLPDAEAERWVRAFQELETDGTVERLRQRYLR